VPVLDAAAVIERLRIAAHTGADRPALLTEAADAIRDAGAPYTSVYLYMLHGDELVLEGFSGRETEHTRIAVGHGVCGTAVATGIDQNVGDVQGRENYIACNLFTRSEIVVLIRRGQTILGQIDVDSDVIDPFTAAEEQALRDVADELSELL
jgi:L-methionine (R)-S-oxide reductase